MQAVGNADQSVLSLAAAQQAVDGRAGDGRLEQAGVRGVGATRTRRPGRREVRVVGLLPRSGRNLPRCRGLVAAACGGGRRDEREVRLRPGGADGVGHRDDQQHQAQPGADGRVLCQGRPGCCLQHLRLVVEPVHVGREQHPQRPAAVRAAGECQPDGRAAVAAEPRQCGHEDHAGEHRPEEAAERARHPGSRRHRGRPGCRRVGRSRPGEGPGVLGAVRHTGEGDARRSAVILADGHDARRERHRESGGHRRGEGQPRIGPRGRERHGPARTRGGHRRRRRRGRGRLSGSGDAR